MRREGISRPEVQLDHKPADGGRVRLRAGRLTSGVLVASTVAALGCLVYGFRYSNNSEYLDGLMVEAPSFFLGGVLLVLLLEWLGEHRTREQWAGYLHLMKRRLRRSCEQLGETLRANIAFEIGAQMSVTELNPTKHGSAAGLRELARMVEDAPEDWKEGLNVRSDGGASAAVRLATSVNNLLAPFTDDLRVVQIPSDGVVLGEAMLRLLDSNEDLQEASRWISVGGGAGWDTAVALVDVLNHAADLAEYLESDPDPKPSVWRRIEQSFNRQVCDPCRRAGRGAKSKRRKASR